MLTHKQMLWAEAHDWHLETVGGGVWVKEWDFSDGEERLVSRFFGDFKQLYIWAGY